MLASKCLRAHWKWFVVGFNILRWTSVLKFVFILATTIGCNLEFQNDKNVEMLETMEM